MEGEQDSGCYLNLAEESLDTGKNVSPHVGDGDIVTTDNHLIRDLKESLKDEQTDFITAILASDSTKKVDVKIEVGGDTDEADCGTDAVKSGTLKTLKENHVIIETILNEDTTLSADSENSDTDLAQSVNIAALNSESESVQKIKNSCNEGPLFSQALSEANKANETKKDVDENENLHTSYSGSALENNISSNDEANNTETKPSADSSKPYLPDNGSCISFNLSGTASEHNNLMKNNNVDKGTEEYNKCKTEDNVKNVVIEDVNGVIKERKETCNHSPDISRLEPADEQCQRQTPFSFSEEKNIGQIKPKQQLSRNRTAAAFLKKSKNSATTFQQISSDMSQNDSTSLEKYSDIMERISRMVKPLHNVLFRGSSTQKLMEHSSTQTLPVSQTHSLLCTETSSQKSIEHSNTQTSPNRTRFPKCLIHSIPKLMLCLDCKQKRCSQCILVDGTCQGHTLAEATHLALQRENVKLMKALETASCDLNQSESNMKTVETEIQNLEIKCLLRREEIQQEFTSFINLLIQQKNTVLNSLDKEAKHRKQYLEDVLEKHHTLQRKEGQLTDEVTSLVQNNGAVDLQPYRKLQSECEKFSLLVKSSLVPEPSPVTSLLDNPFSLYREKIHFDTAVKRDSSKCGDINFRKKTLYMNPTDQLVLEQVLEVPCFPTSSTQIYTVELLKFPRTKVWETSVSSLKDLILNCDSTYCFESNVTYLLRVKVCLTIDQSAVTKVEKEGKPTHMMIIYTDITDNDTAHVEPIHTFSFEEERYIHVYSCCCPVSTLFPDTIAEISQRQYGTDKFTAVEDDRTVTKDGVEEKTGDKCSHQCITAMEEYSCKSLEELRLEDYLITRKTRSEKDIVTGQWRSSPSFSNLAVMSSVICRES